MCEYFYFMHNQVVGIERNGFLVPVVGLSLTESSPERMWYKLLMANIIDWCHNTRQHDIKVIESGKES